MSSVTLVSPTQTRVGRAQPGHAPPSPTRLTRSTQLPTPTAAPARRSLGAAWAALGASLLVLAPTSALASPYSYPEQAPAVSQGDPFVAGGDFVNVASARDIEVSVDGGWLLFISPPHPARVDLTSSAPSVALLPKPSSGSDEHGWFSQPRLGPDNAAFVFSADPFQANSLSDGWNSLDRIELDGSVTRLATGKRRILGQIGDGPVTTPAGPAWIVGFSSEIPTYERASLAVNATHVVFAATVENAAETRLGLGLFRCAIGDCVATVETVAFQDEQVGGYTLAGGKLWPGVAADGTIFYVADATDAGGAPQDILVKVDAGGAAVVQASSALGWPSVNAAGRVAVRAHDAAIGAEALYLDGGLIAGGDGQLYAGAAAPGLAGRTVAAFGDPILGDGALIDYSGLHAGAEPDIVFVAQLDDGSAALYANLDLVARPVPDEWVPGRKAHYTLDAAGTVYLHHPGQGIRRFARTLAPVASCKNATIVLDPSGVASLSLADIDDGSSDPDGTLTNAVFSPSTVGCADIGAVTVSLTVTDDAGATATCSAAVTVTPPPMVARCLDQELLVSASGGASLTPAEVAGGDYCGLYSMSLDRTAFDCGDAGVQAVQLTLQGGSGQVARCNAQVAVHDPPAAITCSGATQQLQLDASAVGVFDGAAWAASDNCDVAPPTATFGCGDAGQTHAVVASATDTRGGVATCAVDVAVGYPALQCPSGTVQLPSADGGTVQAGAQAMMAATNSCPDPSWVPALQYSPGSPLTEPIAPACAPLSAYPSQYADLAPGATADPFNLTYYAIDAAGSCSFLSTCGAAPSAEVVDCTTTVSPACGDIVDGCGSDTTAPAIQCQDPTINYSRPYGQLTPASFGASATDGCGLSGVASIDHGPTLDCADLGTQQVIVSQADGAGNVGTCAATLTVIEDPPTALCQDASVVLGYLAGAAGPTATVSPTQVDGGSLVTCGAVSLDVDTFTTPGQHAVTLTAANSAGADSCSAVITVHDVASTPWLVSQIVRPGDAGTDGVVMRWAEMPALNDAGQLAYLGQYTNGPCTRCVRFDAVFIDGATKYTVGDNVIISGLPLEAFDGWRSETTDGRVFTTPIHLSGGGAVTHAARFDDALLDVTHPSQGGLRAEGLFLGDELLVAVGDATSSGPITHDAFVWSDGLVLNGPGDYAWRDQGDHIWFNAGPAAAPVVSAGDVAPDSSALPTGETFTGFGQLALNDLGDLAFSAALSDGSQGIWLRDVGSGKIHQIVSRPGVVNAGLSILRSNVERLALTDGGSVAYMTQASGWAADLQLEVDGQAILARGDVLPNGETVKAIDGFAMSHQGQLVAVVATTPASIFDPARYPVSLWTWTPSVGWQPVFGAGDPIVQTDGTTLRPTWVLPQNAIVQHELDINATGVIAFETSYPIDASDPDAATGAAAQLAGGIAVATLSPPVAVCQDVALPLDASGAATVTAADIDGGSSDAYASPTVALSGSGAFSCADIGGARTASLVVTNASGLTDSCVAAISVQDVSPPALLDPPGCPTLTVTLGADGTATVSDTSEVAASSLVSVDNCDGFVVQDLSTSPADVTDFTVDCSDLHPGAATNPLAGTADLWFSDAAGNAGACAAPVSVTSGVFAVCADRTLYAAAGTSVTVDDSAVDGGSLEPCGQPIGLSLDQTTFAAGTTTSATLTAYAVNNSAQSAECNATVSVLTSLTGPSAPIQLPSITVTKTIAPAAAACDEAFTATYEVTAVAADGIPPSGYLDIALTETDPTLQAALAAQGPLELLCGFVFNGSPPAIGCQGTFTAAGQLPLDATTYDHTVTASARLAGPVDVYRASATVSQPVSCTVAQRVAAAYRRSAPGSDAAERLLDSIDKLNEAAAYAVADLSDEAFEAAKDAVKKLLEAADRGADVGDLVDAVVSEALAAAADLLADAISAVGAGDGRVQDAAGKIAEAQALVDSGDPEAALAKLSQAAEKLMDALGIAPSTGEACAADGQLDVRGYYDALGEVIDAAALARQGSPGDAHGKLDDAIDHLVAARDRLAEGRCDYAKSVKDAAKKLGDAIEAGAVFAAGDPRVGLFQTTLAFAEAWAGAAAGQLPGSNLHLAEARAELANATADAELAGDLAAAFEHLKSGLSLLCGACPSGGLAFACAELAQTSCDAFRSTLLTRAAEVGVYLATDPAIPEAALEDAVDAAALLTAAAAEADCAKAIDGAKHAVEALEDARDAGADVGGVVQGVVSDATHLVQTVLIAAEVDRGLYDDDTAAARADHDLALAELSAERSKEGFDALKASMTHLETACD